MRTIPVRNPFTLAAFLLGNFSALWGFIVAPIYLTGFGLMLPYARLHQDVLGQPVMLPLELPLIGLILGALGFMLSTSEDHERNGRLASLLGLAFNGVPMALALVLWAMRNQ